MCIIQKESKCISKTRKKRAKHNGFFSPYKGQIPRFKILGNLKILGKSQNQKETEPSA